ncbi:MAG: hypothetical protein KBD76_04235 [Bacteriovorax sp.]|jgi:hypothetical protein|nr:hypothetical protein [Bacteriovorax sp.]
MRIKFILPLLFVLISSDIFAIPPIPPEIIGNEISLYQQADCKSPLGEMLTGLLSAVKGLTFSLDRSADSKFAILSIVKGEEVVEIFNVDCQ